MEALYPFLSWDTSVQSLNTKIRRLSEKAKQLKKNKNEKGLSMLMVAGFEVPKLDTQASQVLQTLPPETQTMFKNINKKANAVIQQNRELKRDIEEVEDSNQNLSYQIANSERKISILMKLLEVNNDKLENALKYKVDSYKLEHEVNQLQEQYNRLSQQFEETVEELGEKKEKLKILCARNVNKKLKRRDETILKKNESIREKDREIESMQAEYEEKEKELNVLKKEKKNLLVKVCRLRQSKDNTIIESNSLLIESLKKEIKEKEMEIVELEQTNAILQNPIIECFHDGKFSNEIRATVMCLITECGVSQNKVNHVMEVVLSNLAGKTLSRLPSSGVKSRLMVEAKRVAQSQVAAAMLSNKGNTLHQDGTSKFHRHFQSFQVTTADGATLSAGLSEIARGDANTLVNEFNNLVSDLASSIDLSISGSHEAKIAELVVSIIATMSDQGSVNPVFNERLQKIRELLPVAFENWDTMSPKVRQEMGKLFSFFL